jgi:hypothetical protein
MGSCLNSQRKGVTLIFFSEMVYWDGFTQMFLQSILIKVRIKKPTTKQNHLPGSYLTLIKYFQICVIHMQHTGFSLPVLPIRRTACKMQIFSACKKLISVLLLLLNGGDWDNKRYYLTIMAPNTVWGLETLANR